MSIWPWSAKAAKPEAPKRIQLPSEFADLQQLADRFGISDDTQRSQRTEEASQEERLKLVDTVTPRLAAINLYLDQHEREDNEGIHGLGRLAEATCEVALEVGWPDERKSS